MTKIIISLLLIAPVFAQTEAKNKTDIYRTIAGDLLKDCTGVDKAVAVAGFSYSDGRDSRDGGVVAERITTELVKSKKFKVIERKEIEKVFEELKLQRSGAINPDSAKEIGQMLGADWVVVGTLTELPDKQLELNARIVAVESGEILSAASGQIEKDWLDRYKKLLAEETKLIENNFKEKTKSSLNPNQYPKEQDARAYYERGMTNTDLAEYDSAIADFGIAITITPTYLAAYLGRGYAYLMNYDYDKAFEDYSKVLEIDPKNANPWVYFGRGLAYARKGEDNRAIKNLNKALEINPEFMNANAYVLRGWAYFDIGEDGKALNDFNMAIKLAPQFRLELQPSIDKVKTRLRSAYSGR